MTYVLREQLFNKYYCKDHNKIIEFDTPEEATYFLQGFSAYAMTQAMNLMMQGNPRIIGDVQQIIQSTTIDEKPKCECEFINFKNIRS